MEENVSVQDELSLSQMFKILLNRIKVLVVVLLAGLVAGAAFGFVKNVNKDYYGTTMAYYVNPYKDGSSSSIFGSYGESVANTAINILSEQKFCEQVLLKMQELGAEMPEREADGKLTAEYKAMLLDLQKCISVEVSDKTYNILYVTISVLNDEERAEILLKSVDSILPDFLVEKMPVPEGYQGTKVENLTVIDEIVKMNEGEMLKDMIKFAVLLGAAAVIVACVVVIVKDRNKQPTQKEEAANGESNE